jgi:hypothetical protein
MRVLNFWKGKYDIMNIRGGIYNFDVLEGHNEIICPKNEDIN